MSTYEAQEPIWQVRCDSVGCPSFFEAENGAFAHSARAIRLEAEQAGWDVPPWRGKGSRRKTDFCPQHAGGGA